ncbi:MAG: DUF4445 domain-containing protein [Deltaproteobacteria bacterium]|nr:DUF4445 domain-containing protein [Deltaproteobacteria bacterium]MBW2128498.1 DUF4445 domain-containing protein [Deltaproteobacteria bacterium]MBW2303643.1 DUF4445 domain-containing protein [Deltaproteobacteria bacterium]
MHRKDEKEIFVTATFLPWGNKGIFPAGTNLLNAARKVGLEVDSVCGGNGKCGKCLGRIIEGRVSEVSAAEKEFLSPEQIERGACLLCRRTLLGDAVIEVEPEVPERMRSPDKGEWADSFQEIDSHVVKTCLNLSVPTVKDQVPDLERLQDLLPAGIQIDLPLIREIPRILRDNSFRVTSVVVGERLVALEGGDTTGESCGIALDIGTTTVGGYLVDLVKGEILHSVAASNRQRTIGADVLTRIAYTMKEPQGLFELKDLLCRTIDETVAELLAGSGIPAERVYLLSVVGNTVMSHLLLAVPVEAVASSPFVPAFSKIPMSTVGTLGLETLAPGTPFLLLPNIAGYVGSDTIGMILATDLHRRPGSWLAIDIGTNGEVALASGGRLLTCSTAAGPAFEGGSIGQGMRAQPGAVCEVNLGGEVSLSVIGGVEPSGICGSGLIDAVAEMVRVGIIGADGKIKPPDACPREVSAGVRERIRGTDKGYKFVLWEGRAEVALTQKDISELQLAKGAIRAGIEILLEELDLDASRLDGVLLAGAFGSRIRPRSLLNIGLLPDVAPERIEPVGNAAGKGAVRALLSRKQFHEALMLAKRCEHRELSLHKDFSTKFARALGFPAGPF